MLRILLVEDDLADALLVKAMLSRSSGVEYTVRHEATLAAGLMALHDAQFDVVLLDLSLPDARGIDTVQQFRRSVGETPIIVLTGLEDEELAIQVMQAGAQDYLVKCQRDVNLLSRAIRYAIERKKVQEHLVHLAVHDPLTGLGNRTLFRDHLEQALVRARRTRAMIAVLYLDLDRFKEINDTLGHDIGDQLLQTVAARLQDSVRESDTVARIGGDEFTVILEQLESTESAIAVTRKVLESLRQPLVLGGRRVTVGASIGVAVYPDAGEDVKTLVKHADIAMYEAKRQGADTYRLYAPEVCRRASR